MEGSVRAIVGLIVLLLPGAAIVWAFFPRLDWAKQVVLAVVFAATVVPAALFAANLLLEWPLTLRRSAGMVLLVTAAAIGGGYLERVAARRRLRRNV